MIVIGWLYIVTGVLALVSHGLEFVKRRSLDSDVFIIPVVEIAAIVAGIYLLRGSNWARWLALAWMGFHVILSLFHPWRELAVHSLLFAAIAYFLFRSSSERRAA